MQEDKEIVRPNFWAVIPATVRYDKKVGSTAKLLFAEITALSNFEGYCWARNDYFAKLFDISVTQVSRLISSLEERGFIKTEILREDKTKRKIFSLISIDGIVGSPTQTDDTLIEKFDKAVGVLPEAMKEERQKFLDYFMATNDGSKKQHWQKQKTFSIKQRWATWIANARKWEKPKPLPSDKEISREAKRNSDEVARNKTVEDQLKEMAKPRTPEEQARVDKQLADMRKNLANKFSFAK